MPQRTQASSASARREARAAVAVVAVVAVVAYVCVCVCVWVENSRFGAAALTSRLIGAVTTWKKSVNGRLARPRKQANT